MWIINVIYYTTAVTILEKEEKLREIKRVARTQEENIIFLCFIRLRRKRELYQTPEGNKKEI